MAGLIVDALRGGRSCNVYFFGPETGRMIIVDPGTFDSKKLLSYIEKNGYSIKTILITHGHFDHIASLGAVKEAFPDARIYINEKEVPLLHDPKLNLSSYFLPGGSISYDFKGVRELKDDEKFEVEGVSVTALFTPFHTAGSVSYYLPREKILFSGDTLFKSGIGRSDLPSAEPESTGKSLRKLFALPDDVAVFPGHGFRTTIGRERRANPYLRNVL